MMLTVLLAGCTAEPDEEAVAAPVVATPAPVIVTPVVGKATGRDECDPIPLACTKTIASRQEGDRMIVYITPPERHGVRPGQWIHCVHDDRPPSPPCEILDIVDGGMLEGRCGEAGPSCARAPKN